MYGILRYYIRQIFDSCYDIEDLCKSLCDTSNPAESSGFIHKITQKICHSSCAQM